MNFLFKILILLSIGILFSPVKLLQINFSSNGLIFAAENESEKVDYNETNENVNSYEFSDYRKIVIGKSKDYGVDWRLILAIMKQESQFDPNAVSYKGAQGLMQLMPSTQLDIADRMDLAFVPKNNIEMGIAYFFRLYKLFEPAEELDRIRLTLAAYNAGPSRIYDAQDIAAYLGENPFSWRAIQNALPLLSKRYYTLHQSVWDGGKPRNGYFGSWRQTIFYVENVMKYRGEF